MQNRVERVSVGVMMSGQGRIPDVFAATASFMKERKRKEEEALRAKRKYSPAQEEARRWVGPAAVRLCLVCLAGMLCFVWR
jgi:type VI protein secretion system component VasF